MTTQKHGPPSIIHAGHWRTGTKSMARAYEILGFRAHHLHDVMLVDGDDYQDNWVLLERAAEAKWHKELGISPAPPKLTRAEWDTLFGDYDTMCDTGSPFIPELIEAYPEAKVIIVQRDFEKWWPSFKGTTVDVNFMNTVADFLFAVMMRIIGLRACRDAVYKILVGWFGTNDPAEIERRAPAKYQEHFDIIRKVAPPGRTLEYRLGDGWEPLCEFLGKEVPDCPFPRVNDRKEHAENGMLGLKIQMMHQWRKMRPWLLGGTVAAGAVAWAVTTGQLNRLRI